MVMKLEMLTCIYGLGFTVLITAGLLVNLQMYTSVHYTVYYRFFTKWTFCGNISNFITMGEPADVY